MDWYVSLNLFPWRNKFLYILSGWVHFFFNCNFWVNCSFKKRVYVFWAVVLCFVWVTVKNAYLKESGCLCKCAESPRLKQGPDLSKLIVHFWLHMQYHWLMLGVCQTSQPLVRFLAYSSKDDLEQCHYRNNVNYHLMQMWTPDAWC